MMRLGTFISGFVTKALRSGTAMDSDASQNTLAVLKDEISVKDASTVAKSIMQYASTPEFTAAIDKAVEPPKPSESEAQFVSRAQEAIRNHLRKKFR